MEQDQGDSREGGHGAGSGRRGGLLTAASCLLLLLSLLSLCCLSFCCHPFFPDYSSSGSCCLSRLQLGGPR